MSIKPLKTVDEFKAYVEAQKKEGWYKEPLAFGIARVEYGAKGNVIAAAIPVVNWKANFGSFAVFMSVAIAHGLDAGALSKGPELVTDFTGAMIKDAAKIFAPYMDDAANHANVNVVKQLQDLPHDAGGKARYRLVVLMADEPCASVETAYLKLIAMSEGHVKPRTVNFNGVFGVLPNLAWVGNKPYELDYLRENKAKLQLSGQYPHIDYVDKLPRFLHHVIGADNTRIIDSGKVRLGAHLAAGTTVMPGASYINFNSGTLGPAMIEGRVSSSVIIGPGTDVGGGASILGVLSGGNTTPISIGGGGLLGANSVCGIPLGDGCIIDAGVTILAGSKIKITAEQRKAVTEVNEKKLDDRKDDIYKGVEFSGMNGLHFRQNSQTGALEAFRSKFEIKLNEALH
jgi:2,3,4,5-tetrahydropyridine-2-carboxylate N-succinyltransferase